VELSMHKFGHTFILQLLELSTAEQKLVIVEKLSSHVMQLSLDPHGCFVMQKAFQVVSGDSRERLVQGLKEGTIECIKSKHGNHVIQVCIEEMPPASVSFILDAVETWGAEAASSHICACRVVSQLLGSMPRHQLEGVIQQILQCVPKLARDRFGNYVLQQILDHGDVADKRAVMCKILESDVVELARQKYGHNVIKKCIDVSFNPRVARAELPAKKMCKQSFEQERRALSYALLERKDEEVSAVANLASDKLGTVVVQCLLDHLHEYQRAVGAGAH